MYGNIKRLITPETRRISRGEETHAIQRSRPYLSGLVIESAEGVRFAYSATQLPKAALPEVIPVELEVETVSLLSETDAEN